MKLRYKIMIGMALFSGVTIAFLASPFFEVDHIVINGTTTLSQEEIIEISQIQHGTNIFKVSMRKSMDYILKNPYVEYIKVKRKLPNSILIDVIERQAIALVPYISSWLVIDSDGVVLEVINTIEGNTLPTLEGIEFDSFEVGMPLKIEAKKLEDIVKVIKAVQNSEINPLLSKIIVEDIEYIRLKGKANIEILIGNTQNIEYKINFAKTIMDELIKTKSTGVVDMSHEGNPIFKVE